MTARLIGQSLVAFIMALIVGGNSPAVRAEQRRPSMSANKEPGKSMETLESRLFRIYQHDNLNDVAFTTSLLPVKFDVGTIELNFPHSSDTFSARRMTSYGMGSNFPNLAVTYDVPLHPSGKYRASLNVSNFYRSECITVKDIQTFFGRGPDNRGFSVDSYTQELVWSRVANFVTLTFSTIATPPFTSCVDFVSITQLKK